MTMTDPELDPPVEGSTTPQNQDPFTTGEEALERAKCISQQIQEKVRKLTEDTDPDQASLPSDPTGELPVSSD